MIETTHRMLQKAQEGGYAVGAFNVENMEMVQAVLAAGAETRAPLILQTTVSTLRYAPAAVFAAMIRKAAQPLPVTAAIHLDHCSRQDILEDAIESGYTSVMFDGSQLQYEDNILGARQAAGFAHARGVSLEAELGRVGGKEDDISAAGSYTDPMCAKDFVEKTGADSLAVAIGTAHGFYSGAPELDLNRLAQIRRCVKIPLVLHGASGLSEEAVRSCVSAGIAKVNFATELRAAFTEGVREYLERNGECYDPKQYLSKGRDRVKALVMEKICLLGGEGRG